MTAPLPFFGSTGASGAATGADGRAESEVAGGADGAATASRGARFGDGALARATSASGRGDSSSGTTASAGAGAGLLLRGNGGADVITTSA